MGLLRKEHVTITKYSKYSKQVNSAITFNQETLANNLCYTTWPFTQLLLCAGCMCAPGSISNNLLEDKEQKNLHPE